MSNNILILATSGHPLYEKLKNSRFQFYDLQKDEPFELKKNRYLECEYAFDFTLLSTDGKHKLLKRLNIEFNFPIISDLSLYWGDSFFRQYNHLEGAMACGFLSPKNCYEVYVQNPAVQVAIKDLFEDIDLDFINVESSGMGFTYPRVVAQIINEAYFALQEGLASKEDIDTAMKFGVNYPLGPFEWTEKIGSRFIVQLLDELYNVTKDLRYRTNPILRLESLN